MRSASRIVRIVSAVLVPALLLMGSVAGSGDPASPPDKHRAVTFYVA